MKENRGRGLRKRREPDCYRWRGLRVDGVPHRKCSVALITSKGERTQAPEGERSCQVLEQLEARARALS